MSGTHSGNALYSYSGGPRFEYRPGQRLSWCFSWFSSVHSGKYQDNTSFRPWPLPNSYWFIFHQSSTILSYILGTYGIIQHPGLKYSISSSFSASSNVSHFLFLVLFHLSYSFFNNTTHTTAWSRCKIELACSRRIY
jgi:hypothetical protein